MEREALPKALDLESSLRSGDFNGTHFIHPQNSAPLTSKPPDNFVTREAERVSLPGRDNTHFGTHRFEEQLGAGASTPVMRGEKNVAFHFRAGPGNEQLLPRGLQVSWE